MPAVPVPTPELRSERVRLRCWRTGDVPAVVESCADPAVARYSPVIPYPYSASDATAWLQIQEPLRADGQALDLAVVDAKAGRLLGAIGLTNVTWPHRSTDIGYWLAAHARGHGYMAEAVRLLGRWVFDELRFARLQLMTDPENVASQRVAERCGFQREGHLRSNLVILHSGERRDTLVYGLLAGELR